ncbi:MAG TPA: glycosyltransferase 87 family protein [Acidimicrobiales bacterium]|nr:glycosyltransferase 87 family protein [Acidimicrobiales bacterium]
MLGSLLLLGWWWKADCLGGGGWQGGEQFYRYCYSDLVTLWFGRGLADGRIPYIDQPLEYPPLIGVQIWIAALLAREAGGGVIAFYNINAALNAGFVLTTLALLRHLEVPIRRQLWWAGAPPVALYAFLNWDPLAVLLLVVAVALHVRGRDTAAGVAAGLGAAAKLFPALLIPLVVIARLRQGNAVAAARHAGAAVLAWAAVNVPLALAAPEGWSRFFELSRGRGATSATLWALADELGILRLDRAALNRASALAFAGGAVLILVMGLRRRSPAAAWSLLLPLLAWFLVTNKVFSPQFDLWLVPLLALLLPGAGPFVAFVVADVAVFASEFAYLGQRAGFGPFVGYGPLGAAVAVRAGVLVWIIVVAMRRPMPAPPAAASRAPPCLQDPTQNYSGSPRSFDLPGSSLERASSSAPGPQRQEPSHSRASTTGLGNSTPDQIGMK